MIRLLPLTELAIQSCPEIDRRGEVSVVGSLSARNPPDSFDGVEFRGVGRQEDAHQAASVLGKEFLQVLRPVVGGIVQDEIDFATGVVEKVTDEVAEGFAVEGDGFLSEKTPCLEVERPVVADLLTGGGREDTGLLALEGPHPGQRAVSLEVHFVLAPELNTGILHPPGVVFLKTSCWSRSASCAWRRGLCKVKPSL